MSTDNIEKIKEESYQNIRRAILTQFRIEFYSRINGKSNWRKEEIIDKFEESMDMI